MIPVLTFHSLDESSSPLSVPPRVFQRGLARLRDLGYRSVPLARIADDVARGTPLPDRAFAITFDDGYRSVRDEGLAVLAALEMEATVFLTVGADGSGMRAMGGRPMLSWGEVRELRAAGVEVGAHTVTHPDLTRLPADRVEAEMRDSRAIIEDALGEPVTSFAYPYGRCDERVVELARRHFARACTTRLALVGPRSDPHRLERVDAWYLRTERRFRLLSSRALPWYLRARAVPRAARAALRRRR